MSKERSVKSTPAMEKLEQELVSSPQKALAFLVRAGIVTPDGKLTPAYRQNA